MKETIVKLTKLSGKPDSSILPGFSVEGPEVWPPEIGEAYHLDGYIRNSDGETWLWFHTTEVMAIEEDVLVTQNSRWKREIL